MKALASVASLWNFGDPVASEARFHEAAAAAEHGGQELAALRYRTQEARALGLQRKFAEAHDLLDSVATALDALLGAPGTEAVEDSASASGAAAPVVSPLSADPTEVPEIRLRIALERGRAFRSSGSVDESRPRFLEAYEIGREAGLDGLTVDAIHMMAIIESGDAAREWFRRGVEMAESSEDPAARSWLGPLYNNYGWTLHDAGRYEDALRVFEKSVDWRVANSGPVEIRIARYTVARALRSLERCGEALPILRGLAAELVEAGESDGYIEEELGECLLSTGEAETARSHFARAHELLSKDAWLAENEPDRLARLKELGTK